MFIDAHRFPGPALWFGFMIICIAVWAFYIDSVPFGDTRMERQRNEAKEQVATLVLLIIGGVSALIILYFVRS
jgi:hypothetical protein